jgi:hypothetical protein
MSLRVATTQWRIDRTLALRPSPRATTERSALEPPNLCTPRLKNLRLAGICNSLFSPQAEPERPEQEIADALISVLETRT